MNTTIITTNSINKFNQLLNFLYYETRHTCYL